MPVVAWWGLTALAGAVGVKIVGDEVEDFTGKTLPKLVIVAGVGLVLYAAAKNLSKR